MREKIINKLLSRKLWAAAAGTASGLAAMLTSGGSDLGLTCGCALTAASVVSYILAEARIDCALKPETELKTVSEKDAEAIQRAEKSFNQGLSSILNYSGDTPDERV